MKDAPNQALRIIEEIFALIWNVFNLIWNWTFGQLVTMFHLPFSALPLWKQGLYVIVALAIAYILFRVATELLEAIGRIFRAVMDLFIALFEKARDVLVIGIVALALAWIISNVGPVAWLDSLHL